MDDDKDFQTVRVFSKTARLRTYPLWPNMVGEQVVPIYPNSEDNIIGHASLWQDETGLWARLYLHYNTPERLDMESGVEYYADIWDMSDSPDSTIQSLFIFKGPYYKPNDIQGALPLNDMPPFWEVG